MSLESVFKLSVIMNLVDNLTKPMSGAVSTASSAASKLESVGKTFGTVAKAGAVMQSMGAQIVDAVMSPVEATFETRRALGELASLGIEDLDTLESAARSFSDQWAGTTKADFITAAYDIKSGIASLSDEGVAEYTSLAGLTAKATKSTIGEMTDLFATGYGIYKGFYGDLSDIEFGEMFSAGIGRAVQAYKTNGSEMASAIRTLGGSATTAQVPLEEQLSVLGMLQATMSGSEAGTKYKAFLRSATKGGEALGLSFTDANNQLLSMPEILDTLRGKFGDTMDAAEKMELQKAFGDTEAVALIDLLYSKTGELQDGILDMYDALGSGTDVATEMANAINETEPEKYERLQQRIQNVKESIGTALLPTINSLLEKGEKVLSTVGQWIEKNQGLVRVIMLVVLGLGGFLAVGGTVLALVGGVGLVVTKAVSAFDMLKGGFAKISGAIGPVIKSVWSFTAALLANPVTWIVIGIVALVAALVLLYKKCEGFRNIVNKAIAGVVTIAQKAWSKISAPFIKAWNVIKGIWEKVTGFFKGIFGGIGDDSSLSGAGSKITGVFGKAWSGVKGFFSGAASKISGWFSGITLPSGESLSEFASTAWSNITGFFSGAASKISGWFEGINLPSAEDISNFASTAWSNITGFFEGAATKISGWFEGINLPTADDISNFASTAWTNISTALSGAGEKISGFFDGINISEKVEAVSSWAAGAWQDIKDAFSADGSVSQWFQTTFSDVGTTISNAVGDVASWASEAWEGVKSAASSVGGWFANLFGWGSEDDSAAATMESNASSAGMAEKQALIAAFEGSDTDIAAIFESMVTLSDASFQLLAMSAETTSTSILTAITNAMDSAVAAVQTAVATMQAAMNFTWSLPHLKVPHVNVSGAFSLEPPSAPSFSVSWYKQGGILTQPTIFGARGNTLLAGGEAGPEAVLPLSALWERLGRFIHTEMDEDAPTVRREAVRPVVVSTAPGQSEGGGEGSSSGSGSSGRRVVIQQLVLQTDLKKIKDLKMLLALLQEIEQYTNGNGDEDPDDGLAPMPA